MNGRSTRSYPRIQTAPSLATHVLGASGAGRDLWLEYFRRQVGSCDGHGIGRNNRGARIDGREREKHCINIPYDGERCC